MDKSVDSTALRMAGALVAVSGMAACVERLPGLKETQSLRVTLVTPTDTGAIDRRLDDAARDVVFQVEALGPDGERDLGFEAEVDVYAQFLGTLTPRLGREPLVKAGLRDGVSGQVSLRLPSVFGQTVLWVEDGRRQDATYATGTSPVLWYRDPFIVDISTPVDQAGLAALTSSPLQNKQVVVGGSRYGDRGRLVVTSTYAQGYTVSDVQCADASGTPPCVSADFDHVLVFSFSRPRDTDGRNLEVGQSISGFAGGVTEFIGLTELSFPQTFVRGNREVNLARLPAPRTFQLSWLDNPIEFEKVEAGLIQVPRQLGGVVCPLDSVWDRFKQWKINVGRGCDDSVISVVTDGAVAEFDPAARVGQPVGVIGSLRPINGTRNVWIVFPRSAADLDLQ